jgi:hypothetical protein
MLQPWLRLLLRLLALLLLLQRPCVSPLLLRLLPQLLLAPVAACPGALYAGPMLAPATAAVLAMVWWPGLLVRCCEALDDRCAAGKLAAAAAAGITAAGCCGRDVPRWRL